MSETQPATTPLVSIVIPCYNHGHFLSAAIESCLAQTYPHLEVIVVDDGSTDNTKKVCKDYPSVSYLYQQNQGLPASRNNGVLTAKGDFVVFLDADDWLYPDGVQCNIHYLLRNPELAFVSGGYVNVYEDNTPDMFVTVTVNTDHYRNLLAYNYIGMVAAVIFRRSIFNEFRFDEELKSCEDHDLYLKVSRKYPVLHHTNIIAAYRRHAGNMSALVPRMLSTALQVLKRQEPFLKSALEKKEYGIAYNSLYEQRYTTKFPLLAADKHIFEEDFIVNSRYKIFHSFKKFIRPVMSKATLVKNMPTSMKRFLNKTGIMSSFTPRVGDVSMGDLDRVTPFSKTFGFDRGGAVDRYYIESWLQNEAATIKGRVLEIGDNAYTLLYGGDKVSKSDILHVDATNEAATFVGDISDAPHVPDNAFDCIVFTQTLHLIYDFKAALRTCHRILKPGGSLLLTVPGITPIDRDEWNTTWYWSFTDKVMKPLFDETFPGGETDVNSFGNVYSATAFLYGMGLPEVEKEKLDHHDPYLQVIVSVKATKK